jgi:P-type Ca2+ transporter type 2C
MVGSVRVAKFYKTDYSIGPPSQSLGVDPVDPAVMRRPPRKKDAPIITKKLLWRVLFSASIIVIGTLFVYVFALTDSDMSKREQTMVCDIVICV